MWKRQLKWLQQLSSAVAAPKLSAGGDHVNKKGGISKTVPRRNEDANDPPLSDAEVRCPSLPLDSKASATAACVDSIFSYYLVRYVKCPPLLSLKAQRLIPFFLPQACYRWREMCRVCVDAAGDQPLSMLNKVFPPGRLVQLQLSTEAMGSALQSLNGGRLSTQVKAKYTPNWSTWAVILEVTKVVNVVMVGLAFHSLDASYCDMATLRSNFILIFFYFFTT